MICDNIPEKLLYFSVDMGFEAKIRFLKNVFDDFSNVFTFLLHNICEKFDKEVLNDINN